MNKKTLKKLILPLILAAAMTAAAGFGLLRPLDSIASDAMYNVPEAVDELVTVIGVDQRALEELGPWPWTRDVMAMAINALNRDPDKRPAVIGIDIMYCGYTQDAYDDALVKACEKGGNVVVAEAASFASDLVLDNGSAVLDKYHIQAYDAVFPELREAASPAHINALPDTDGVIRHAKLFVDTEDCGRVYSLAAQLYTDYCEAKGLSAKLPKTDRNGFYYLPYSVEPGGYYDGISVADLISGEVKGSHFAGKIVLIGPYAAGMQDQYITSIDHAKPMFGVEIQANALTALVNGVQLSEAGEGWQLVLVFLTTFLGSVYFTDRKPGWSILCLAVIVSVWLMLCMLLPMLGVLLHPLWIPVPVLTAFVGITTQNYIRVSRERKRVSDTFKRYLDPAIIAELMKEGTNSLDLGGKLCDIAVLFVDIRGFTTMSEKLSPQEVVSILNRYLTLTTECVMRYNGTLDKYVGDCTMAIWNAPVAQEDYIMKACRAALDMVKGSAELNKELEANCGRSVSFGVGINCGQAIVGNIGSPMRMDFTAIGDTVNTAARLESNAPGGKVYISRDIAEALKGRIRVTNLGTTVKLKGKAENVEIYTLDGLADGE